MDNFKEGGRGRMQMREQYYTVYRVAPITEDTDMYIPIESAAIPEDIIEDTPANRDKLADLIDSVIDKYADQLETISVLTEVYPGQYEGV